MGDGRADFCVYGTVLPNINRHIERSFWHYSLNIGRKKKQK